MPFFFSIKFANHYALGRNSVSASTNGLQPAYARQNTNSSSSLARFSNPVLVLSRSFLVSLFRSVGYSEFKSLMILTDKARKIFSAEKIRAPKGKKLTKQGKYFADAKLNSLARWCSSRPLAKARGLWLTPKLPPKACFATFVFPAPQGKKLTKWRPYESLTSLTVKAGEIFRGREIPCAKRKKG